MTRHLFHAAVRASVFRWLVAAALSVVLGACTGTTGGDTVRFDAALAGPVGIVGHELVFTTGRGMSVRLTKATLVVGAVYMNRTKPIPIAQENACILPGTYVGEVLGGAATDLLSGVAIPFPSGGSGTSETAVTGEVWLTRGDVNASEDRAIVAEGAGAVTLVGSARPFRGSVSFGSNRRSNAIDPARPGADAPCKQRIVSPIPIAVSLQNGGSLTVRVDPRAWFATVPFEDLADLAGPAGVLQFDDGNTNISSMNLADGIRAAQGAYSFEWKKLDQ